MDIQLFCEVGQSGEKIRDLVKNLVALIATRSGVKEENIKRIGIASSENYGKASGELFSKEVNANNLAFSGVGKTETKYVASVYEHTILFDIYVFNCFFKAYEDHGESILQWPHELLEGKLIINHELGHCRFNEEYHQINPDFPTTHHDIATLDGINNQQLEGLIAEIGACFYSDRFISKEYLHYCVDQQKNAVAKYQVELNKEKTAGDVNKVAYLANTLTWLYLIQYAKLAVGKKNTEFESESIVFSDEFTESANVHRFFEQSIDEFCDMKFGNSDLFIDRVHTVRSRIFSDLKVTVEQKDGEWTCFWS